MHRKCIMFIWNVVVVIRMTKTLKNIFILDNLTFEFKIKLKKEKD